MAETTEKIYRIKFEGTQASIDSLVDLKDRIAGVKEAMKQLDKTTDDGKKKNEELILILKDLDNQYKSQQKEIQNRDKQMKSEADTLEKMRARLSNMYAEYAKIPVGTKAFTDQQKAIKELKDKIDDAEQSAGHFQRNVGNYKQGVVDAFQQMGIPIGSISEGLSQARVMMGGLTTATGGTTSAMKVLKVAMASTGIGLLIVALGTLVGYFTSSGDRADKLKIIMAPFVDLFKRITGAIYSMIDGLSFVFDWIAKVTGAISTMGQEVVRLKDEYERLQVMTQEIISEKELEKARLMNEFLQRASKTEAERLETAKKVMEIEDAIFAVKIVDLEKRIQIHEIEKKMNKEIGDIEKYIQEGAKLRVERNQLEIETIERKNSITKRMQSLLIELGKDEKNEAEEARKLAEEKEKQLEKEKKKRMEVWETQNWIYEMTIQAEELQNQFFIILDKQQTERLEKVDEKRKEVEENIAMVEDKIEKLFPGQTEEAPVVDITDDPEIRATLARERMKKDIYENTVNAQIEAIKKKAKEEQWTEEQTANFISQIRLNQLQNYSEILGRTKGMFKENSTAYKLAASGEAIISTYAAIAKTLKEPTLPFPANVIMSAVIGAQGMLQVANINKVKFAKGGIVGGQLHEQGGTKYYGTDGQTFEAERGELITVVNRYDTERLASLSRVNSVHGKPFFASGGMLTPRTDFGGQAQMVNAMKEALNQVTQIPVVVSERDISKAQRRVYVAEKTGDL